MGSFGDSFYFKNQVLALLSKHLVIPAYSKYFSLEIKIEKATKSLREDTFLEESLSIIILKAIGILESEPIFFSLLFPKENKSKALKEIFLKAEEAETLFERCFAIQHVWGFILKYTCFIALELALER